MAFTLFSAKSNKPKRVALSQSQKQEVLSNQHGKCKKCHKSFYTGNMCAPVFDHIKEVYRGGPSTIKNTQALCRNCHGAKTQKHQAKVADKKRKKPKTKAYNPLEVRLPKRVKFI